MAWYRKKPVEVQAMQFYGDSTEVGHSSAWSLDRETSSKRVKTLWILIPCGHEGTMQARIGDWIIKGVAGEFYPCKPEIFAQTYEYVTGCGL